MSNSEIFISYAWGGESEAIIDNIYPVLAAKNYRVIRDKIDLGYKGNIKDFMQQIGAGSAVVVVISDKYLKSENCMFEMLEIHRNKDTWKRIFPIVLADAKIYRETDRIDYITYWDKEIAALNAKIKTMDNYAGTAMLQQMNTLTPDMHKNNNFEVLIAAIENLLGNTIPKSNAPTKELLKERIKADLSQLTDFRKKSIYKRLEMLYKLLDDYEAKLVLD